MVGRVSGEIGVLGKSSGRAGGVGLRFIGGVGAGDDMMNGPCYRFVNPPFRRGWSLQRLLKVEEVVRSSIVDVVFDKSAIVPSLEIHPL